MSDILAFVVLLIFIVMSPEFDFALITKRTLTDGKKDGIKIALGITTGVLVHTVAAVSIVWFATIVFLLSYVRKWLMSPRVQNVIDKATGLVLIGFGLNMIFRVQRTGSTP